MYKRQKQAYSAVNLILMAIFLSVVLLKTNIKITLQTSIKTINSEGHEIISPVIKNVMNYQGKGHTSSQLKTL